MAQFKAVIRGGRGPVSRLGSKKSGMYAEVNGWDVGIEVFASYDYETGEDTFEVFATRGSNGRGSKQHLATVREGEMIHQSRWNTEET